MANPGSEGAWLAEAPTYSTAPSQTTDSKNGPGFDEAQGSLANR
jgi:hypothetical protein